MTKYTLKAEKRIVKGKKIRKLRKEGILPGNLFGKNVDSQSVQIKANDFDRIYKQVGETGIIYLQVDGESKERPVLVSGIAFNPTTNQKYHVDLHQVNLKEKVTTHVPVEIIGESDLVKSGAAILNQSINEIEIEALPTDIPESITFDISLLKEIGDNLKVSDAKVSSDVEVKTDPELPVISLAEPQKEEELPTAEEVPAEAEVKAEVKTEETPKE